MNTGSEMKFGLLLLIAGLVIVFVTLWFFERMFARRPGRGAGLTMPILFFVISVMSVVQAAPKVFGDLEHVGGVGGAVASLVLSFLIANIPTVWGYYVYVRTRRKMGEYPWPLRHPSEKK